MLRPNYSTGEHVSALIKIFRPSLVTRDTRFTLKERVFNVHKKPITLRYVEHESDVIKIFRPSLIG